MSEQETKKAVKKSVSLPATLMEQGEAKARAEHRSFSSYIQSLIAKDLSRDASPAPPSHAEESDEAA